MAQGTAVLGSEKCSDASTAPRAEFCIPTCTDRKERSFRQEAGCSEASSAEVCWLSRMHVRSFQAYRSTQQAALTSMLLVLAGRSGTPRAFETR